MKINNKGGSLVELLIMLTVGSVAVFGLINTSQQVSLNTQVLNTHQDTLKLKNQVYTILNNNNYCTDLVTNDLTNLPPPADGGTLQRAVLPTFDDDAFNTITVVEKTLYTPTSPPETKIFNLYYKYSAQGMREQQKTKGGNTCTANNLSGCFRISCNISTAQTCNPVNCSIPDTAGNFLDVSCDPGKILVGTTGREEKDCIDGCDDDGILIGTKAGDNPGDPPKAICFDIKCPEGQVATGFGMKADGTLKPRVDCTIFACPEGEHIVLEEDVNGNKRNVCKKICHGGQVYKQNDLACSCPDDSQILDSNGNCKCSTNKKINPVTGSCECISGMEQRNDGECICKHGRAKNPDGGCFCGFGKCFVAGECTCKYGFPETQVYTDTGQTDPTDQYMYGHLNRTRCANVRRTHPGGEWHIEGDERPVSESTFNHPCEEGDID